MILARFFRFRYSGNVENIIDVPNRRLEGLDAEVTSSDDFDGELADPAEVGPAVANQAAHTEAALQKEFNGMTADESRTAGNEECLDSGFLSKTRDFVDFRCLLKYIQKSSD